MRLWLKVVLGLVSVSVLLIGMGWFWLTGPERELAKNPIMSFISQQTRSWDHRVPLMPKLFLADSNVVDVEKQLMAAGFTKFEGDVSPTGWMSKEESSQYKENLKRDDEIVFVRNHGTFVCDLDYIVFLKFDSSNSLISAEGVTRGLACL